MSEIKLTKEQKISEYAKCVSDYTYAIENYFTVQDKTRGEGEYPFLLFDFQKEIINNYNTNKSCIVNKYRQAGISTLTAAYIACYLTFNNNKYVVVVADKLKMAENELFKDVVSFMEMFPRWMQVTVTGANNKSRKEYSNGSQLVAMASNSLRGPTPDLIWWDETAHCETAEDFITSASAALSTGGRMIMVSTPNGLDAVFYQTFKGAQDRTNDYIPNEIYWYNDPRYTKDLKLLKDGKELVVTNELRVSGALKTMINDGWIPTSSWYEGMCRKYNNIEKRINQELNCSFLGSDSTLIPSEVLQSIVTSDPKEMFADISGERNVWLWKNPEVNKRYIISADVSLGTSEDFSGFQIICVDDFEQVAEYLGKLSPEDLGEMLYHYGTLYGNAYIVVDIQGGAGTGTVNRLLDLGYKNIHYTETRNKDYISTFMSYIKKEGDRTLIPGFMITTSNRPLILTELEKTIRNGDIKLNSIRLVNELKTFVMTNTTRIADHKRSYHDDLIFSLAIGLYTVQTEFTKLEKTKEITKAMLESYTIISNMRTNDDKENKKEEEKINDDIPLPIYNVSNNDNSQRTMTRDDINSFYIGLFR